MHELEWIRMYGICECKTTHMRYLRYKMDITDERWMAMRQKLITLCPNSFEIAQKKGNFSQWVRSKLLEEGEPEEKPIETYLMKCPMGHQLVKKNKHAPLCPQCHFRMSYIPSVQLTLGGLHDEL